MTNSLTIDLALYIPKAQIQIKSDQVLLLEGMQMNHAHIMFVLPTEVGQLTSMILGFSLDA